jgi:predicted secreted protein
MKIGLTTEQIERLQNGESVEVTAPDLVNAGQNAVITIEKAANSPAEYLNIIDTEMED